MPSTYTPQTLPTFDCSAKGVLTPLSYYMLVLLSLTGLSTLLGLTDFRMADEFPTEGVEEVKPPLTSSHKSTLRVEPHVLEYCKRHTQAKSIFLKRRFEYRFRIVGLEVVMLHFQCDQKKLHLVEVYHFKSSIWQDYLAPFLSSFGKAFRDFVERSQFKKAD